MSFGERISSIFRKINYEDNVNLLTSLITKFTSIRVEL